MLIKSAKYLISSPDFQSCPKPDFPEYAFIGRSNVGKSSLVNMITGWGKLAKTSKIPGKTKLINHFIINNNWYLVDLPGFGFAKTSKTNRIKLKTMINNYLLKRQNLLCTFALVESRLKPQQIDLDFFEWMAVNKLPFVIVFTKTDKLNKTKLIRNIELYKNKLLLSWEELPRIIISSAKTSKGKDDILNFIEETNKIFFDI